ncbi:receptor-type tyrosine-protein phosphatase epsilon-like isoform X2 [Penaeus chinensis]|nr:receptor-type tyrosine-protein phosphatase epsilon-like isoform X2 [Penaeus chinensis]
MESQKLDSFLWRTTVNSLASSVFSPQSPSAERSALRQPDARHRRKRQSDEWEYEITATTSTITVTFTNKPINAQYWMDVYESATQRIAVRTEWKIKGTITFKNLVPSTEYVITVHKTPPIFSIRHMTKKRMSVIGSTPTSITLYFQEKPSRDRYNAFATRSGSQQPASSVGVVSDKATLTNLQPGTEYEVSVTYSGKEEKLTFKTLASISLHLSLKPPDSVEARWSHPGEASLTYYLSYTIDFHACRNYVINGDRISVTGSGRHVQPAVPPYAACEMCIEVFGEVRSAKECKTIDTPAGLPESKIERITCNGKWTCNLLFENDCTLIRGPNLCAFYKFSGPGDSEQSWQRKCDQSFASNRVSITVNRPQNLLPYTTYSLTAFPATETEVNSRNDLKGFTTFTTPSKAPGKVTDLKVSAAAHSLTLTWFDPSDNPLRGKLLRFRVTWNRGTRVGTSSYIDLPLSEVPEGKEGRRSHTITDLEAGEDYYVEVLAQNAGVQSFGDPNGLATRTLHGVPSPPRSVNYSISDGQVSLSWEPSVDMAGGLVFYVVVLDGRNLSCAADASADLECLLEGLTAGEEHVVTVRACNSYHCSDSEQLTVIGPGVKSEYIILPVVLLLLLLCLIIFLIVWYRRKPSTSKELLVEMTRDEGPGISLELAESPAGEQEELVLEQGSPEGDPTYENLARKITKADLNTYLTRAVNSQDLADEFKSVPSIMKKSCSDAEIPMNRQKNRYKNNLPYNDTRVALPFLPNVPHSDYINASYVNSYQRDRAFIASQGPKDFAVNTIDDFWRMIWHTGARVVVMVTRLVEGGRVKVAQYWPEKEPMFKGGLEIHLKKEKVKMDFVVRTLCIRLDHEEREVKQYQFLAWPDHGVPLHAYSLAQMVANIRAEDMSDGPLLVHCSAGIGRTGTILLVLHALDQLEAAGLVSMRDGLLELRKARPLLVENVVQYRFAHQLLHEILCGETTSIPCGSFLEELERLRTPQTPGGTSVLQEQYQRLRDFPKGLTFSFAKRPEFAHLNRDPEIVPADGRMIFLYVLTSDSCSQYINATFVNGFDKKDEFVAMEHPMEHTLDTAWRMIYERKMPVWILVHAFPDHDKDFPSVLPPAGEVWDLKNMRVEVISSQLYNNFSEATVQVSFVNNEKVMGSHRCAVLQAEGWPADVALPSSPLPLLAVLERLDSLPRTGGPPLFSCRDGVSGSGLTVALQLVLSRAKLLQEIDIYRAALSAMYDRPQFITSLEQYDFLHEAARMFLDAFSMYGNFT